MMESLSTRELMMVRPSRFSYNPETSESNAFQNAGSTEQGGEIARLALMEFDHMVGMLRSNGVTVHVFEDQPEPPKPDAVFPNNWISFHADGRIITYPMMAESRQREVRQDILRFAMDHWGFSHVLRLDARASGGHFLEGTGSLVLDRPAKLAYACLGPRTEKELLLEWCDLNGYEPVMFTAVDRNKLPIYHTNVIMGLGDGFAVVCSESIHDPAEKSQVLASLENSGKSVVHLSMTQMEHFAGNMLQVRNQEGKALLVMSEQARQALDQDQLDVLCHHAVLLPVPLWTIERYGGGSARCMMAEVFRP